MATLDEVTAFCDGRTQRAAFADFPGSVNGLQVGNSGKVTRIAAAVDAGLVPFRRAARLGADLLIVHHGLFWGPPRPLTGPARERLRVLFDADCAVYSSHLPLDAHPEIGNNALLARALGLEAVRGFLPHEGRDIGLLARGAGSRAALRRRLGAVFPRGFTAMEFGSARPRLVAVLTGSGMDALPLLGEAGVDTLVTGELRQHAFNIAQEQGLNLYCCGHHATEVFGVRALAAEAAARFGLPWSFIDTACPL